MKATRITATSLLFLSLPLVGFLPREDAVAFEPSEGATVSKELNFEGSFYMDDVSVIFDGNEMPSEMMGAMDEAIVVNAVIAVTDEYVSSSKGKQLTLLRTYDDLTLEGGIESDSEDMEEFGELVGSTVSFKWNADTEEYDKTYHEGEGDEDLLENLEVDMDFLVLLPDGEVSEGDTWEASGEDLGNIFFPGGMPANPSGGEDSPEAEELGELFKEEIEGQLEDAFGDFVVNCTYKGTRDEGGTQVGVIEFKFEGEADLDLTELILAAIDLQAGEMGIEADLTATVGFEFDGEGMLLWNLKGGHVAGFEMSQDLVVTVDLEGDVDAMGEAHSFEVSAEVSGEMAWALEASSEDSE